MAAHGSPRRGNGITDIMENFFSMPPVGQQFLRAPGISEEKLAKLGVQTIDPLTGGPPEPDFRYENFANSNPGSNQNVPDANLGEQAKTRPEQGAKQADGLLREILTQVTASVKMIFRHISVIGLPRPGLPWGFTLDAYGTLPTRATLGQARSSQT